MFIDAPNRSVRQPFNRFFLSGSVGTDLSAHDYFNSEFDCFRSFGFSELVHFSLRHWHRLVGLTNLQSVDLFFPPAVFGRSSLIGSITAASKLKQETTAIQGLHEVDLEIQASAFFGHEQAMQSPE